jgi:hypothetical protein
MSGRVWDMGDPEPPADVIGVKDDIADDYEYASGDSPHWGRVTGPMAGHWKGYKDGGKRYLEWPELLRRWGPVTEVPHV